MIQFNQIGCYSCGAGLFKTDGLCKCQYCGNTNLIQNNKTQIVWVEHRKFTQSKKTPKSTYVLLGLGLFLFPIVLLKKRFSFLYSIPYPENTPMRIKVRLANGTIIEI